MLSPYRKKEIRRAIYKFRRSPINIIGVILLLSFILIALMANYLVPYPGDYDAIHMDIKFQEPSWSHLFGTDRLGRDLFSRVLMGVRVSLTSAMYTLALVTALGIPLGLLAGYAGGKTDMVIMRVSDMLMSIPSLMLALAISALLEPSLEHSMLAISVVWWPAYARLIRGEVFHAKEEGYVEAAKSYGAGTTWVVFREIMPNVITPLVINLTMDMGYVILTTASLGFLGLGAQPPIPELGTEAAWGRMYFPSFWWLTFFPGFLIFLLVLDFCVLGDGIRDAFVGD